MCLNTRAFFTAVALGAAMPLATANAEDLSAPTGPVVLTITGNIGVSNAAGALELDLDMLREIGATEIVTETIWTSGENTFVGVSLNELLDHIEADGETIMATAINDYSVEIPVSDAIEGGPIVAYELNGQPMSRRDKGPLWVIYPYSASSDYRTEVIYSRSIWQMDRMTIE